MHSREKLHTERQILLEKIEIELQNMSEYELPLVREYVGSLKKGGFPE